MTPIKVFESSNLKHGLRACVQIVFCIMWHKQGNFKFPIDDHFWCLRSTRSASGREMFCSHQWSRKEMPGQSADPFTDACWTAFVLKSCRVHMQDTHSMRQSIGHKQNKRVLLWPCLNWDQGSNLTSSPRTMLRGQKLSVSCGRQLKSYSDDDCW